MTIISYAQNFEDVMLWRALGHIDKGFYIDVGANDPVVDSVTKAFYDAGWRGINIEPVPQWFAKMEADRPRDINLNIAAGSSQGTLAFYEIADTGLSTFDEQTALRHQQDSGYTTKEKSIEVTTLTQICNAYHIAPIHFLKIDVEGHEKDVLMGLDLDAIRPWIIIVEATIPNSQKQDYEHWDYLITDNQYDYVYFDGLNRYYVAHERKELETHFSAPPNVFDGFQLSGLAWSPFCNHVKNTLNEQIKSIESECKQHSRWLQNEWDAAKAALEQQQQHGQWLQGEWDAAKAALEQHQHHGQWLQSEWDAAKAALEQQQLKCQHVEGELLLANSKVDELNQSSHHWFTVSQDLQNKADELNRSSHHWFSSYQKLEQQARIEKNIAREDQSALFAKVDVLQRNISQLQSQQLAIQVSTSWRLTAPLRWTKRILVTLLSPRAYIDICKKIIRHGVVRFNNWLYAHPRLRLKALSAVKRIPFVETRLRRITGRFSAPVGAPPVATPENVLVSWDQAPEPARTAYRYMEEKLLKQGKGQ